jgi:hypothetical protein
VSTQEKGTLVARQLILAHRNDFFSRSAPHEKHKGDFYFGERGYHNFKYVQNYS